MPIVSIIVPCYNEQATIRLLLEALCAQTYPNKKMEIVIADGLSTDLTRDEILAFREKHPDLIIRIIDNHKKTIPAGLNAAIRSAKGDFIVRLDAHSMPYPDYVQQCVEALEDGKGDNVGGIWEIRPGDDGWIARSISLAAAHPIGVGDARYRLGGDAQEVDTVPFGAYRRSLVECIGLFDESLLTNEDYEFNVRVRQSGGTVWFDPAIRSTYFARCNLSELAQQYWRYGYWKAQMIRRYPKTIRLRQFLPPAFVFSIIALSVLSFISSYAFWLLLLEVGVYFFVLLLAGVQVAMKKRDLSLLIGVPISIATMHVTWGGAFLLGILMRREGK